MSSSNGVSAQYGPGTIVLPVSDLMRYSEFFIDILNLLGDGGAPAGTITSVHRSGSVVENINLSLRGMGEDHEWAWIMGDDHRFEPGMLKQLLAHEVDIVVPLCVRRTPPFTLVIMKEEKTFHDERLGRDYPGYVPYQMGEVPNELFTCVGAGSAGMLIKRRVLDEMGFPWFESSDGVYLNEDLEFCRKARAAGFEIHVDPYAYLGHIGQMMIWPSRYEGQLVLKIDHGGPEGTNEVILGEKLQPVTETVSG